MSDLDDIITRFRGDDEPHTLHLTIKKVGSSVFESLDLDLVNSVEFSFLPVNDPGTAVTYVCAKNADPLTGLVEVPFAIGDVGNAGDYDYDVQVVWAASGKKKTLIKSLLILQPDVNKG